MLLLSASDLYIADALKADALSIDEETSRFGESFFAIRDTEKGTIEVFHTKAEAETVVDRVKAALAAS